MYSWVTVIDPRVQELQWWACERDQSHICPVTVARLKHIKDFNETAWRSLILKKEYRILFAAINDIHAGRAAG